MDLSARFLAFTLHGAGWVLWLLIGLSVASLAVMIERFWYVATHRLEASQLLTDMRTLLKHATDRADTGDDMTAAMEGAKAKERMRLERNLAYLATLGSNAPFIGLFGTVLGIIK